MYLTYEEYQLYGGRLDKAAFNVFAFEACKRLDAETHGRIAEATETIKRCASRLTDLLQQSSIGDARVNSWSNDGVSESLKDVSPADYESQICRVIHDYLINETDACGVPLLYLGGVCDD